MHEAQGTWVKRTNFFDIGSRELPEHLKVLLPPPRDMPDGGGVIVWGFIGRGECIYTYRGPDGSTMSLYRPGDVVYDSASLESIQAVPVTDRHPPEEEEWKVTQDTWRQYAHGTVLERAIAFPEFGIVAAPFSLNTAEVLAAWQAGKRFLSTGELSLEVERAGEVNGQIFDRVVVQIRYNHLALTSNPAAGPLAQIRAHQLPYNVQTKETDMEWITIVVAGKEFRVPKGEEEAYRARINSLLSDKDGEITELTRTNSQLQAKNDELTATVEELRAAPAPETGEAFQQRVHEASVVRVNALTKAWPLIGDRVKAQDGKLMLTRANSAEGGQAQQVDLSTLDDAALYREAILVKRPNSQLDGKDRSYLEARLDMLLEHQETSQRAGEILGSASTTARANARSGDGGDAKARRNAAQEKRKARLEGRKAS